MKAVATTDQSAYPNRNTPCSTRRFPHAGGEPTLIQSKSFFFQLFVFSASPAERSTPFMGRYKTLSTLANYRRLAGLRATDWHGFKVDTQIYCWSVNGWERTLLGSGIPAAEGVQISHTDKVSTLCAICASALANIRTRRPVELRGRNSMQR
jgi:hypothetical protein